jgi:hypothetical protein
MWTVPANYLSALSQSHGRYTRMEAWFNGAKVADLVPESGQVQVTAKNRIRRMLSAVVSEAYWPTIGDPLDPSGAQLKVYQGITGTNGNLIGSEVPIFTGRVETVQRQRLAGKLTVTALDPFGPVNDQQFEQPEAVPAGLLIQETIKGLISNVVNVSFVDTTGIQVGLPVPVMWDTDRGAAIDELASALGAEVFFLPDGVTCTIRPIPVLGGTSVWTLTQGVNSTIVRDAQTRSRTDVANRMIVHVEQPNQTPFTVTISDDNPQSPTRYGGPYGKVVRHLSNPLISSYVQAEAAGRARLARLIGVTRSREVDMVPNPALEAGDLITIVTDEGTEQHIVDSFALPLAVSDVMTVTTRSTTSVS